MIGLGFKGLKANGFHWHYKLIAWSGFQTGSCPLKFAQPAPPGNLAKTMLKSVYYCNLRDRVLGQKS
ncbi:MAG TPA: hypothetical protein VEW65_12255, partial [Chryseolinea sp.]|nr:hypothetical protein [Chryseolinea sp.]